MRFDVGVCRCMSVYVSVCHCMSLYVVCCCMSVCECMWVCVCVSLYVSVCCVRRCMSLYRIVCQCMLVYDIACHWMSLYVMEWYVNLHHHDLYNDFLKNMFVSFLFPFRDCRCQSFQDFLTSSTKSSSSSTAKDTSSIAVFYLHLWILIHVTRVPISAVRLIGNPTSS